MAGRKRRRRKGLGKGGKKKNKRKKSEIRRTQRVECAIAAVKMERRTW